MAATSSATGVTRPRIPARTWYTLFVLTLAYGFNFLDRQILVILQEPIKAEMGLSDAQLGLLTGFAFALFYVTAGIPIAWWADRANRRSIVAGALGIWSAMTAASGFAQSYLHLVLARIGVGVGEAGCTPPAHAMISDLFPPNRRATAIAIYTLGIYLGIAGGFAIGGYVGEHFGWRMAFFVAGVPGLLLALVVRFTVSEPLRGRWDDPAARRAGSLRQAAEILFGVPRFWWLAAGCALANVVNYGALTFNPSFLIRSHDLTLAQVGLTLALVWSLSGMLGTYSGGALADRLGRNDARWYLWVPALGQLLAIPFSLLTYLADDLTLALTSMFVSHTLLTLMLAPTFATAHALVPPSMRALSSSVLLLLINLVGLGCGPLLVGMLSDSLSANLGIHSLRYALLATSLISLLAAAAYWWGAFAKTNRDPVPSPDASVSAASSQSARKDGP